MFEHTTPRLHVRDWTSDLDGAPADRRSFEAELAGILTDPVLEHLPNSMRPKDMGDWIAERRSEARVLTIRLRDTGAIAGLILIAPEFPKDRGDSAHVGYLLGENVWGKGLATEALSGLIDALAATCSGSLVAGVARIHTPSIRVLQNAGFRIDRDSPGTDRETCIYLRDLA